MWDNVTIHHREPLTIEQIRDFADRFELVDVSRRGEFLYSHGGFNRLNLLVNRTGLKINGSLPKYFYNNNICTLDTKDTKNALVKLSNDLGVDVLDDNVTSLEFGLNVPMVEAPANYFSKLGTMKCKHRNIRHGTTLEYSSKSTINGKHAEEFVLYDKVAECRRKRQEIPPFLESSNILRLELRLHGRLKERLGQVVRCSDLFDKSFCKKINNLFVQRFDEISKVGTRQNDIDTIKTPKDAFLVLAFRLLNQDPTKADDFLQELHDNNVFADGRDYYRLKRNYLDKAQPHKQTVVEDERLQELIDAVCNCV